MRIRYERSDKDGMWRAYVEQSATTTMVSHPMETRQAAEQWAHLNVYDPDTGRPIHKYKP